MSPTPIFINNKMALHKSAIRKPARVVQRVITQENNQVDTPKEKVSLDFDIDPKKTYTFETLKKSATPRTENLGSRYKAFDDVEKRYRDIGYYPTAPSIFVDEWDESVAEMQQPPLSFYRDTIYVSGEDIRLMEYMMNHPLYEHSPFRVMNKPAMYTLADKEINEGIKARTHAKELKALQAVTDTPIDELKPIARVIFGVTETSDVAIVNAMNELIKKPKRATEPRSNAEKVLDNLNNPLLQRKYIIQSAVDKGILSADTQNTMRATLVEGAVFVCNLTKKSPDAVINEIVDFMLTPEGEKSYNIIRNKVNKQDQN